MLGDKVVPILVFSDFAIFTQPLLSFLLFLIVSLCLCDVFLSVEVRVCVTEECEVGGQLSGTGSLLPPRIQGIEFRLGQPSTLPC